MSAEQVIQADMDLARLLWSNFAMGGVSINDVASAISSHRLAFASQGMPGSSDAGWQPIETAPKDGTVLVAGGTFQDDNCMGGPYPFSSVAIAEWCDSIGEDHPWQGEAVHSHDEYRRHAPTHWLPLPTPPAQGAALSPTSSDAGE